MIGQNKIENEKKTNVSEIFERSFTGTNALEIGKTLISGVAACKEKPLYKS